MQESSITSNNFKMTDKESLILKLNCMLIALMMMSNTITESLVRLPMFKSFSNNLIVLILAVAIAAVQILLSRKFSVSLPALAVAAFASIWYFYTMFFHYNETTLTPIQFIFYAIIPIYAVSKKADGELVLRYILYMSFISLPSIFSFFVINHEQYSQTYLANIYSIITPATAAIIHFALYRKKSNIVIIAAYIYSVYILYNILLHSNRGAILCLSFCIIVLVLNTFNGEERKKMTVKKAFAVFFITIAILMSVIFAKEILLWLDSFFSSTFHFVPSFVTKMLKYIEYGDISDGRNLIDSFTVPEIINHPIFGHGIQTFKYNAEHLINRPWPYPHQYIYQFLFEGGLIFGAAPVYLSLSLTFKTIFLRIKQKNEFALCCLIVCLTLPKLLFSTDAWSSPTIWMLITYSLMYLVKHTFSSESVRRKLNNNRGGNHVTLQNRVS